MENQQHEQLQEQLQSQEPQEQKNLKINFNEKISYQLSMEDSKQMYICLGLVNYEYFCRPTYNERKILIKLHNDFNRFVIQIKEIKEKMPNNLNLYKLSVFFQNHTDYLNHLVKQLNNENPNL